MRPGEDRTMDVETISTGSLFWISRWAPAVSANGPYRRDLRSGILR